MNKLIAAGLFGGGLVPIREPHNVESYRSCMHAIGKPVTKLSSFNIDGRGWSPEVAEEIGETNYLANGDANPYAIIVTTEQKGLPVYHPHHSFDRYLLTTFFEVAGRQIADLTSETGLWVELDHRFDRYTTPDDLAMMESVIVRANSIGNFMDAARKQRALIHNISVNNNWANDELRREIIESSAQHGDLRHRAFVIEDVPYMNITSFHMRVFGGVYVFRESIQQTPSLVVFEKDDCGYAGRVNEIVLTDANSVLDRLRSEGLLGVRLERFREKPLALQRLKETVLNLAIFQAELETEGFDMISLTTAQRKSYLELLRDELPATYYELNQLERRLEKGEPVDESHLSPELQNMLLRPAVSSTENPVLYDLLMGLVVKLVPIPFEVIYAFNKSYFFDQYSTWTDAKQRWAIERIRENRLERANRKG